MRLLPALILLASGLSRADDFVRGADVSWLPQMEASGWTCRDDSGNPADCLKVLRDHGMNTIRLRVWVNPSDHPRSGHCSRDETAAMAARAHKMGFRILLDFHYSDTWADPSHQTKPAAWAGHDVRQLGSDVFNHTTDVLKALREQGVTPEWVQVGNEIASGMLWPEGKLPENFDNLAGFIRQGAKAVKSFDPSIKIIVHLHGGEDEGRFRWFFDELGKRGVGYDVIGLSYYPFWTKDPKNYQTTIRDLGANLKAMAARYQKPVMVVETGGPDDQAVETRAMLQEVIRKVREVPDKKGLGVLYWEPQGAASWSRYKLSCWNADGRPTEALDAFLPPADPAPSKIRAWISSIDDGDRRTTLRESGNRWNYDSRQDDGFTLLRHGSIGVEASSKPDPHVLEIDRTTTYQTLSGFGAALTDSSAFVLSRLKNESPEMYAHTLRRLFSRGEGAGFSVLRLAVGASDYVATDGYFTCCDEVSPDLKHFDIARDRSFVIPVLKDILQLNPGIRLIATPWSAPAWMKTNGRLEGIRQEEKNHGSTCRLKDDCFGIYADYLVRFLELYQNEGIRIDSLTLQNEPQNDQAGYPCMRMDEADQIRLVKLLSPKITAKSLTTRLLVHDHNWILHPNDRAKTGGDAKQEPLDSVLRILADPDADRLTAGSAWHVYSGGPADMARVYETLHGKHPAKEILTTELSAWGLSRGAWWGDVSWGLRHHWLEPLNHWNTTALQWNLALDRKGGPTPRDDSKAVGLVTIDGANVRFEREFYPMAHLSIAAPPGSKRAGLRIPRGAGDDITAVAFVLPDGGSSLVVVNQGREARNIPVRTQREAFEATIPGHGIGTFVW